MLKLFVEYLIILIKYLINIFIEIFRLYNALTFCGLFDYIDKIFNWLFIYKYLGFIMLKLFVDYLIIIKYLINHFYRNI